MLQDTLAKLFSEPILELIEGDDIKENLNAYQVVL
jgi:hypothetical protein